MVEDCDCEDCDPHLLEEAELSGEVALEELLDCGLLLEVESGVEVLPVAPVVLCALELLPTLLLEPVCALLLAVVSGVEDCEELGVLELWLCAVISLCGGFDVLFGLLEVELAPFGVAEVEELELEELPEMLPAVFWSELDGVAAALPAPEEALAAETVSSLSSTFLTPETDFASFLASFLSSLLATLPLSFAVPLLTEICTPCRAGLLANCW